MRARKKRERRQAEEDKRQEFKQEHRRQKYSDPQAKKGEEGRDCRLTETKDRRLQMTRRGRQTGDQEDEMSVPSYPLSRFHRRYENVAWEKEREREREAIATSDRASE